MSAAAPSVAVLDLGKTNTKFLVVNTAGDILRRARLAPTWVMQDGLRVLDDAAIEGWLRDCLAQTATTLDIGGLIVSGHGCTVAVAGADDLAVPVLDYEQDMPPDVAARIDPNLPPFAESLTPWMAGLASYGRQLLWLYDRDPTLLDRTAHILAYPQFWGWRLGGGAWGECSYLGCHSHMWNPLTRDYSSLVTRMGWRDKMPPLRRAGDVIGELSVSGRGCDVPAGIALHNGIHDSNAALALHRAGAADGFTLVSSGTWVVIMNPGCPVSAMAAERDMLCNVDIDANPVPTVRFMGGREYEVISKGWRGDIPRAAFEQVIADRVMALPSFAEGGLFHGRIGRLTHEVSGAVAAAVAVLYVALMTDLGLDMIHCGGPVVVDGGLVRIPGYGALLAQLRNGQLVLASDEAEGSAKGAALLAFRARGLSLRPASLSPFASQNFAGLEAYRDAWRATVV